MVSRPSPSLVCLMAGAALALTLPKPGLCPLAWCAPAFLLYFAPRSRTCLSSAWLGGLFGFGYCFISLFWVYSTGRFAGVPVPVSLLAVTALASTLALNWAVFGAAVRFLSDRLPDAALPWAWAALWTAIESASAHWSPRVGVDLLAYTQYRHLALIQIGALLGPHALAFVIVAWNGALAEFTRGRRRSLAFAGILVVVVTVYGGAVLYLREEPAQDGRRVEILQPNIDQYVKWEQNHAASIRESILGLLESERPETPDLVLWPESSVPGWIDDPPIEAWISRQARGVGAPMIVGAISDDSGGKHNSAVLFERSGLRSLIYHKRRLVPFGEFVPLRPWFIGWIGILAQMGEFHPGRPRQDLFGDIAANICYEAVFPHLLRSDSARGARVFVNLTNDGWYKDTAGPYQHFYTNMYRAVENRVTVLRSANTGISGVIDPYGVVLARTKIGTRMRLDVRLSAHDPFPRGSLFSRHGDILGYASMAASFFLFFWRKP